MPSSIALPQYTAPPAAYTPQTFGSTFSPWGGGTDPTSGSQNPYAASIGTAESQAVGGANAYAAAAPGMQNNINTGTTAMNTYNTQSSAYPSYPNVAGAGSQTAGSGVAGSNVQPVVSGQSGGAQPTTNSNGFNPWSLTGEAMTRT